ncbi:MAG: hypothetical protein COU68_02820, partial [Candidatus Pacebacteria bacterium CG10_big_fil_rev_8_21_14_0_10_45_6]
TPSDAGQGTGDSSSESTEGPLALGETDGKPSTNEKSSTLEVQNERVANLVSAALESVRNFINNPQVEEVNEKVAAPAVLAVGIANMAAGAQLPNVLVFLRYIFGQPVMLARRRKRKKWGIVYNGFTKEPVDLATVRVIDDTTGRIIRSQVTDRNGRYFLFIGKGKYRLEVIKPGFDGFSAHLKDIQEDAKYSHLYHGGIFDVQEEQKAITYNIPVDPDVSNKPTHKIVRDHSVKIFQHALSMVGLVASVVSFIISPSLWIGVLIGVHVLFYAVFRLFAHKKLPDVWGMVKSLRKGEPLQKVVVRVFDSAYNKLINTAVTDRKGRYAVLVGPSVYYVTYEKTG